MIVGNMDDFFRISASELHQCPSHGRHDGAHRRGGVRLPLWCGGRGEGEEEGLLFQPQPRGGEPRHPGQLLEQEETF